jgi:hypothetical protein
MLGANVPTVRKRKDKNIHQAVQERRGLAITWRRDKVLKQALNILNPGAELSALEPSVLMKLQNRLHFLVLGKANPKSKTGNPVEKPLSEDFFEGMAKVREYISQALNYKCRVHDARVFINHEDTFSKVRYLLDQLIQYRYSPDYDPNNLEFIRTYEDLLRHYVTPQIYLEDDADENIIDLTPGQLLERDKHVEQLWAKRSNIALQKLDFLKREYEVYDTPQQIRYGRCAEAHSVVGVG